MNATSKIPPLRFKGFEGAWEEKRLERLVKKRNESAESGDVPKLEYEDVVSFEGVLKRSLDQLYVVKRGTSFYIGDVLYGKLRPYLGNWFLAPFNGVAVGDWWVLKPDGIDSECLYALIQTEAFQVAANQSTGSKMPRADWNLVSETLYSIPLTIEEQQKIGSTFRSIDALIADRESAVEKLQTLKKAMLGKMFPRAGAKVPEVRFKGFDREWESVSIDDAAEVNPSSVLPDAFEYVDLESVTGTEMIAHRTESKISAPSRAQRLAKRGDVFYQTVRPYQKNNFLFDVDVNRAYVFSTGYAQLRPRCDGYYLLSYLQTDEFVNKVLMECTGTSYPAISDTNLAKLKIFLPGDVEQRKIGAYFRSLDALISARQEEVGKLKDLKKALLDRMFV